MEFIFINLFGNVKNHTVVVIAAVVTYGGHLGGKVMPPLDICQTREAS